MKRILKRYKSTLSILGGGVPKTEYKPLKRKLQNASKPHQPTAFKNLLRSRGWFVEPQPTAFKKVLRLRAY